MTGRAVCAGLILLLAEWARAQTPDGSLASAVLSDAAVLASRPTLAEWRRARPAESRVEPSYEDPEYLTQGSWCAGSAATIRLGNGIEVRRLALFHVPEPEGPLSDRPDRSLVDRCRLLQVWYSAENLKAFDPFADAVAHELRLAWGEPLRAARFDPVRRGWGWGLWDRFVYWKSGERTAVVAVDPAGRNPQEPTPRALVILRDSSLPEVTLDTGQSYSPASQPPVQAGPDPNGELARMARMKDPCSFEGREDWRVALIAFAEETLRRFPRTKWTPWVHRLIARTLEARLYLTYPGAFSDVMARQSPLDPPRLRADAIAHYRAFLDAVPGNPETRLVWQENFRLLAGMPPLPIQFGCGNE